MKRFIYLLLILLSIQANAQTESICRLSKQLPGGLPSTADVAEVSDTIHIRHYSIRVDTIDFTNKSIRANVKLNVEAKQNNVNLISLSLLQFTIDSVKAGNQNLTYTYNDTALRITPPYPLNNGQSILISISYHGNPQRDDSNFGGYYFQGQNYAFNIGVGFAANPHVFGRCW